MIFYKKKTVVRKILNSFSNHFENFEAPKFGNLVFLKGLAVFFLILISSLYILYLFFLPKIVDEDKVEQFISNYLSKNTKLSLDIENLKIYPNYKLDINLKADYIKLKYPDKSDLIALEKPDIDINLLNLFFGYIDLNRIKAKKLALDVRFLKSQKYSVFDCINLDIFNSKSNFEFRNLKIGTDRFEFNLFDENINQKFSVNINKFTFFDTASITSKNKNFSLNGKGLIKSGNYKIADLAVNIGLKTDVKSVYALFESLSKLNYNPLRYAFEYKFYSKMLIDLQMDNSFEKQNISGKIKLSDYTFSVKGMELPKNDAELIFKDRKISFDSNFNFIKNQFIKIKAKADFSKNNFVEARLNSPNIELSDLKDVLDTLTKVLNIKFDASEIELSGLLDGDLYLKSNFKTLVSSGILKVKNAKLSHKKLNLNIDNINSDISFNNNKINIANASCIVNGSKFYLKGDIDEKTNLNIKADSDLIEISKILSLIQSLPMASKMLPKLEDYTFKSGMVKINTSIKGNLKNPVVETNSVLKNFRVLSKSPESEFYSPEILISANPDKTEIKEISFKIRNSAFKIDKYVSKIPEINLKIKENDIVLDKTPVNFEGINLNLEGIIKNYKSNPDSSFEVMGTLPLNNEFISIKTANSNRIDFKSKINVKNNNVIINLFNLISGGKAILTLNGEIKALEKPELNNIKITVPDRISIYSKALDNLSFDIKGDLSVFGNITNPNINSSLNVYNLNYKPMDLYLGDIIINSKNSVFYINSTNSKIKDIDFDFVANAYYKNNKLIADFIQVNSNYIDLSRFQNEIKKVDLKNIEAKDIKGNIQYLTFGGINLNSLKFEGSYKNNLLTVSDFSAGAYDGTIQGKGRVDLKSNKVISDVIIKDIALRKLLGEIEELKKLSIAVSGHFSALIKGEVAFNNKENFEIDDLIRNTEAYIKFNINNGELAQFAKLERFLQAGNILSQSILKLSLNSIISVVTKQNTGDFKTIEGTVKISNSKADIQYIKTIGTNMSLYLEGKLNLISRYAELNILGRIPVNIVSVMGNLGKFTTQKLVDKMSDDSKEVVESITASPIEKMMSINASFEEIAKIPPLSIPATNTREFKVNIFGPISETKSINNFKWIIKN